MVQDARQAVARFLQTDLGPGAGRLGIAVSGGGDSLALLVLCDEIARARGGGPELVAVTVDHGLRRESAAEAEWVAQFCARRGIAHDIRTWRDHPGRGNLMEEAARARRELIRDWAAARGLRHLALGHTRDDQAETLLMNLARGSGIDGLAGLRPTWAEPGLTWHRPLLGVARAALRACLQDLGLTWIEDPTNDDPRFARPRARRALAALAPLGLGPDRLALAARNLAQAQEALKQVLAGFVQSHVVEDRGALRLPLAALAGLPAELQRRFLVAVLAWFGGAAHPPTARQLAQLQAALAAPRPATLGGVRFVPAGPDLQILRELRAARSARLQGDLWDHRWHICPAPDAPPWTELRPLGPDGLCLCPGPVRSFARAALLSSPAFWRHDQLVSAPLAGFGPGFSVVLSQPLVQFILSH